MTVSAVKILQPGEISGMPADDTPLLVVPQNAKLLFEDRARRLEQLAPEVEMPDWLRFCAVLARAQATCVPGVEALPIDENAARESLRHGLPPLSITTWPAGAGWDAARQARGVCRVVSRPGECFPGGKRTRGPAGIRTLYRRHASSDLDGERGSARAAHVGVQG